eukprot:429432-Rhodomonas_salina.7
MVRVVRGRGGDGGVLEGQCDGVTTCSGMGGAGGAAVCVRGRMWGCGMGWMCTRSARAGDTGRENGGKKLQLLCSSVLIGRRARRRELAAGTG